MLKLQRGNADQTGMVDGRLLKHWEQLQTARGQARAAIPSSWWRDPRPEMQEVIDAFVEAVARRVGEAPSGPRTVA
jgi:hypothetical protein